MNKISLTIIALIFVLTSCKDKKEDGWETFESEKWIPYESGVVFEKHRRKSIFYLVYKVLEFDVFDNKGTNIREVRELLGEPNQIISETNYGSFYYEYEIEEKFEYNIDPNGGMDLQLHFDSDSTLVYWRINEYWYKP